MIYRAIQLIQIFSAGPATGIRGGTRGPRGPKKYQEEPKTTEKNQKGAAPLLSLHIGEVHILLSQTINQLKESPSSPLFTPSHFMGWAIL